MSERTLLEAALARLDDAARAVMRSAATDEEQHQILGSLVGAHSLLHALRRADPAAVDELLQHAIQLADKVSQPKTGAAEALPARRGTWIVTWPARLIAAIGAAVQRARRTPP